MKDNLRQRILKYYGSRIGVAWEAFDAEHLAEAVGSSIEEVNSAINAIIGDEELINVDGAYSFRFVRYEYHQLCELLPEMSAAEYQALKLSVTQNGLIEPIELFEGKVLDGRHRQRACWEILAETGVPPKNWRYVPLEGTHRDAYDRVIAKGLARREMSKSQKACMALRLMLELDARRAGGAEFVGKTSTLAAERCGVSDRYVQRVKAIHEKEPGLVDSIATGELSIGAAERIISPESKKAIDPLYPMPERIVEVLCEHVLDGQEVLVPCGDRDPQNLEDRWEQEHAIFVPKESEIESWVQRAIFEVKNERLQSAIFWVPARLGEFWFVDLIKLSSRLTFVGGKLPDGYPLMVLAFYSTGDCAAWDREISCRFSEENYGLTISHPQQFLAGAPLRATDMSLMEASPATFSL